MDVATSSTASATAAAAAAAYAAVDTDPGPATYTTPSPAYGNAPAAAGAVVSAGSAAATPPSKAAGDGQGKPPAGPLQSFAGAVTTVFAGQDIEVDFRVAHDPNEIVIVYRNAETGEIVNQVPKEAIVRLAEFFQREASGAILDQGA
jgi:uncharacterized FlaG/YvyC family protein